MTYHPARGMHPFDPPNPGETDPVATTARDIRYGRQGGRVVAWDVPTVARLCDVCGMAVLTGGDRHHGCTTDPPADHPSLFDDDQDDQ